VTDKVSQYEYKTGDPVREAANNGKKRIYLPYALLAERHSAGAAKREGGPSLLTAWLIHEYARAGRIKP